ncbi:hypothetical protein HMPREF1624_07687 [Sporothrix schenckii ATCC 58251]|uniref:Uncharacterized protein n=1 Tax=Sporothrix schenckii (strain ATCC 58251 / de Perez 2211183) TaxID=1391915 RepID=U7PMJ2_SPOS1|nr:hypothetical protein HMPREF1624_07687 [Sporothrix schenckii ATCC 58251]
MVQHEVDPGPDDSLRRSDMAVTRVSSAIDDEVALLWVECKSDIGNARQVELQVLELCNRNMPRTGGIAGRVVWAMTTIGLTFRLWKFDKITRKPHRVHVDGGHVNICVSSSFRDAPAGDLAVDRSGFALYNSPATEKLFVDEDAIRTGYYAEVVALVREKLSTPQEPVTKVVIFDHTVRRRNPDAPRQPVQQVLRSRWNGGVSFASLSGRFAHIDDCLSTPQIIVVTGAVLRVGVDRLARTAIRRPVVGYTLAKGAVDVQRLHFLLA